MPPKLIAIGALTTVVTTAMVVALLDPASSAPTIKVYESRRKGFERLIRSRGKPHRTGDYDVSTRPLFDTDTGKRVGRVVSQITIIRSHGLNHAGHDPGVVSRVAATFQLPKGRLEVAGSTKGSQLPLIEGSPLAVIGGTEAYEGASGSLRALKRGHKAFFFFYLNP
jgi:hypothetical protein